MKITKEGKANKAEVWRCKCPLCETEVKIIEGDPSIIKYHNCSGSFRREVHWGCPVCGETVVSATGEHHGSHGTNIISVKTEVLTQEEKEELMGYPGLTHVYCGGKETNEIWWNDSKWNCNN